MPAFGMRLNGSAPRTVCDAALHGTRGDDEMKRRDFLAVLAATSVIGLPARASAPRVVVAKSPFCGCCTAWIRHMQAAGFDVEAKDVTQDTLYSLKASLGIRQDHASCHTAIVEGYVIEGHVPASDVKRLLAERPSALGLAVPGMPIGSPGMEMGDQKEPYETLLVFTSGKAEVFARHN